MNNKLIIFFLIGITSLHLACSAREVNATITVLDEGEKPVAGATVGFTFSVNGKFPTYEVITDSNGVATVTAEGHIRIDVAVSKEGYYKSYYRDKLYRVGAEKKQVPYDPDEIVTLKEIKKPIALFAAPFDIKVPKTNEKIGYDLFQNDWISPYGKGKEIDLYFEIKGYYKNPRDHESFLIITFPNPYDGVIETEWDPKNKSELKSSHLAPLEGYQGSYEKEFSYVMPKGQLGNPQKYVNEHNEYRIFIIRTRTVVNEEGEVIDAKYGKFYGDFNFGGAGSNGSWTKSRFYYINPTSLDRNIEFDPKRNLAPITKRSDVVDQP
jgi:hypothetical protein